MLRQLEIRCRTDEHRLPDKFLQADSLIFPQVLRLSAQQKTRPHLRQHPERRARMGAAGRGYVTREFSAERPPRALLDWLG
jgi:hypothetical protein